MRRYNRFMIANRRQNNVIDIPSIPIVSRPTTSIIMKYALYIFL